jgi:hypothetical protein
MIRIFKDSASDETQSGIIECTYDRASWLKGKEGWHRDGRYNRTYDGTYELRPNICVKRRASDAKQYQDQGSNGVQSALLYMVRGMEQTYFPIVLMPNFQAVLGASKARAWGLV